ncbi:ATP-binding protein [Paractinoplanes atraurantiacus]|uniref:Tetratricopeptide (TPR) repeat n=1 Tax=Paractinoplanes atraurantiacus TaxID=1036182 RepID=A0A285IX26_9ACTN|nr:ATP-binding protein [Actinoplanes atraurantiacus]SNY52508.1 Tetratricopeptide (TPR) repeat [Actinoplanes atraurantiacus]
MPESIQSIRRRRRGAAFVGRGAQLAHFRANLELPETDPGKCFIFNVHGEGGVGKSTLLERWRQIARELGAAVALVDEHVFDTPEAMSAIVDQLSAPAETKEFRAKYSDFVKGRERLESDPQAPRELWSQVVRTGVKAGLHASKALPGAAPLVDLVDGETAADAVDRARQYVIGKIRDFREAKLLLSPTQELSPAFLEALGRISTGQPVVLFFDTFEQTGVFLEDWLLDVMLGTYGDLPGTVTLVIAGRHPLDPNAWSELLDLVAAAPLNPFTDAESRQLLSAQGITDPRTVDTIIALSGGLPLLTDMLAKGRPVSSADVGDPTGTAVERFLKWETDPARRDAALAGSLPRLIDEDLLTAATGKDRLPGLFDWLTDQAFVRLHTDRYRYHDVVRHPMVRWQRQRSPQRWREAHLRLATVFRDRRAQTDPEPKWSNTAWQENNIELTYHELCAQVTKLDSTLADGVNAATAGPAVARRWAEMVVEAGRDVEDPELLGIGSALLEAANAEEDDCGRFLTVLLNSGRLNAAGMASCLLERARIHHSADESNEAVRDATEAIRHNPDLAKAYVVRAIARGYLNDYDGALADFAEGLDKGADPHWTAGLRADALRMMDRHEEALADFELAIQHNPADAWLLSGRGYVYTATGRYDEALTDLGRAIGIDPTYAWAMGQRAKTYRLLGRHEEALAEFDRVIGLDPAYVWAIVQRGMTYRVAERYDEALADIDQALDRQPGSSWILGQRGETYRLMDRYGEALADFDKVIELDPEDAWALASRGQTYAALTRFDQALRDLEHAVELGLTDKWVLAERASAYRRAERYDEALAEFDHVIDQNPDYAWAIGERAETYRLMKSYDAAIADFTRAVGIDPAYAWAFASRGQTYTSMLRYDEALADLDRAIELDPNYTWAMTQRAVTLRAKGRYDDALTGLDRAIEIDPAQRWTVAQRAETYRFMGRYDDALAGFDRAIELDPSYDWAIAQRAETYRQMRRYDEALASLAAALARPEASSVIVAERAETYRHMGRNDEALADFNRAVELDPTYDWALAWRGQYWRQMKRYDLALADLDRAVEADAEVAETFVLRGLVHRDLDRRAEATADFAQAARLEPLMSWAVRDHLVEFEYRAAQDRE